ncbi:MAG: FAD/NAD(P)-binding oxidoreductase [Pseudomonadota bacterium]|nr:FAD/NAD(P)-binding oxidoreductase [Pseudomonadota bacterium]
MNKKIKRRDILKIGGAGLLGAAGSAPSVAAEETNCPPGIAGISARAAELPAPRGPRVVVVGGGWSGLIMAKYLKRASAAFDVVLVEKNAVFISCPISNIWLAGGVEMEFLAHSYIDAANNNDYVYFNATVVDLDRPAHRLYTDRGHIRYDYLVLAPGIDYDYEKFGAETVEEQHLLRSRYPAGFISASERLSIKRKLETFKGGVLAMTVPSGNYRCMAAPYERACMAASIFKRRGIKAKILLLDMNTGIRVKEHGFTKAFETYYGDVIEYENSVEISGVDLEQKEVVSDFDNYPFDDAIIYPQVRASRLIEQLGLASASSPQKEADTDPFKYHMVGDERVYVTGDSRSQPYSKSGNTANSEAKYVAEVIAAHAAGKEAPWRSPQTMCFSAVKTDPVEAISIIAFYAYDEQAQSFAFDRVHTIENWSAPIGQAAFAWAEGMYQDMFY